jgi:sorting nexin-1/2
LFLESDQFALEARSRKLEVMPEKTGILANWTGPRYFEQDDWFDSRKNFLEALESQLKGLSKSIETASKARLELAVSMGDFAASTTDLAESDLGSAMCAALARLADLARQEKEVHEEQAKGDVMTLLNMSDEYVRFIGSVRLAFAARIRAYHHWQNMEKETGRMKQTREKLRQQGKLGDRAHSSLGEISEVSQPQLSGIGRRKCLTIQAERRVRDSAVDFENISKLIKNEFVRFERERVEEFKTILEKQLDTQIGKQRELIEAWEEYHGVVLKMVQKSQGR